LGSDFSGVLGVFLYSSIFEVLVSLGSSIFWVLVSLDSSIFWVLVSLDLSIFWVLVSLDASIFEVLVSLGSSIFWVFVSLDSSIFEVLVSLDLSIFEVLVSGAPTFGVSVFLDSSVVVSFIPGGVEVVVHPVAVTVTVLVTSTVFSTPQLVDVVSLLGVGSTICQSRSMITKSRRCHKHTL